MGAGGDILEDNAFEIAAGDAVEVEKDVVATLVKVLVDGERPGSVRPAIADEDGLLDASHRAMNPSYGLKERYQNADPGALNEKRRTVLNCPPFGMNSLVRGLDGCSPEECGGGKLWRAGPTGDIKCCFGVGCGVRGVEMMVV